MTTPLSSSLVVRDPMITGVIKFDKRGKDSGISGSMGVIRSIRRMGFDRAYSLHRSIRTSILIAASGIPERTGFRNARFNLIYNELRERNSLEHDVIRNLSLLTGEMSLDKLETKLRLFAPGKDELEDDLLRHLPQPREYIVLNPGSAWKTKMWHWQGYREVAEFYLGRGYGIVLTGAPEEREINQKVAQGLGVVDMAGRTGIDETMFIVNNAALVICNDSMTQHLASAFKVPNVTVFCATTPDFGFSPWENRATVVEKKGLHCKPCHRHGGQTCPEGTEACMRGVPASEVIDAAENLLKG